jgi:CTP synthase (UTP-ammonia lyase)
MKNAGHAEYDPAAIDPLIVPIACAVPPADLGSPVLSGGLRIVVQRNTLAHDILQRDEVFEGFHCSYELNPDFQETITTGGLRITGFGDRGEARIVELPDHRFFFASLFLPQHNSTAETPHPIVTAFLRAAADFHTERAAPAGSSAR